MTTHKTQAGFSLIELMIVVLVVSILVSIAIPTYQSSVRKSRRTEARSALVDLQAREERYFNMNPSQGYTTAASALGYAASGAATDFNGGAGISVGSGYYTVQIAPGTNGLTPTATGTGQYTITATAVGAQLKDTSCKTFSLDQGGLQGATDSSGASGATVVQNCWK